MTPVLFVGCASAHVFVTLENGVLKHTLQMPAMPAAA
jgi:hypothetical protein